jgi:hypothetical protein
VNGTLPVEKARGSAQGEYTFVPDVGVDVESLSAVETETDELLRCHLITGQGQRMISMGQSWGSLIK